jgi:hypothetical protein
MKKNILIVFVIFGFIACESEKPNLIIEGQIKGLKKGKLYLQKFVDTTVVNLDSVTLYSTNQFRFEQKLDYPQVMYLELQKDTIDPTENFISFFADKGQLKIEAKLDRFIFAEIEGNYPNQQEFKTYSKTMKRFGDQKLDLIKAEMEARRDNNSKTLDSVNIAYNTMNKRRSLFAVNFAKSHPDLEVAPYVVLNQSKYIRKSYLDTIYQTFDRKVQKSHYGKKLKELITKEDF